MKSCFANANYTRKVCPLSSLDKLFGDWYFALVELNETGDKAAYQNWQDHYEG